jgi:bacillithiol system protein YtxJ
MKWNQLTTEAQLQDIIEKSSHTPQVIFKYSGRCSISDVAKTRLERKQAPSGIDFYILDVIFARPLSNKIARDFGVQHESPQILVIRNAECIYDESHLGIRMDEIAAHSMAA